MPAPAWITPRTRRVLAAAVLLLALAGWWSSTAPSPAASASATPGAPRALPRLPFAFEPNRGQAPPPAQFVAHVGGAVVLISSTGLSAAVSDRRGQSSVVSLEWVGAAAVQGEALEVLPGSANYFVGDDPARWLSGLPMFSRVRFAEVWPGIDLVFRGEGGELEYDFILKPGADPSRVRMAVAGARLAQDEGGALRLEAPGATLTLRPPTSWEERESGARPVESGYSVAGQVVAFRLPQHDPRWPLVIDPVLSFSTYLGGTGDESGIALAVDGQGRATIGGVTTSANFPTAGALQGTFRGGTNDAFVARLNAAGTALEFATYLGGSGDDDVHDLTLDAVGNIYLTGATGSSNFPLNNPLQATYGGGTLDAYVAKLNAAGSALIYSTYLGGSGRDHGNDLAVDALGAVYVVGETASTNFPTASPLQATYGGGALDAFVAKLNPGGSALTYSTWLGGSGADIADGVAVDGSGSVVVCGNTTSANFPLASALQGTLGGTQDAFVARLNAAGSALAFSTYLGGTGSEVAYDLALDGQGSAWLTGYTTSADFPAVAPIQTGLGGGYDAFVTRLDAAGSAVAWSTWLGGAANDIGYELALDDAGFAWVTGFTASSDFPTVRPLQNFGGANDAFVAQLEAQDAGLWFSTWLGGSGFDYADGIALDSAGNVFVTGYTGSSNFPTAGALQATLQGSSDAFAFKLCCFDGGTQDGGATDGGTGGGGGAGGAGGGGGTGGTGGGGPGGSGGSGGAGGAGGAGGGSGGNGGSGGGTAGGTGAEDGGEGLDGGTGPGPQPGCRCGAGSAAASFPYALLILLGVRWRRRGQRGAPPARR